MNALRVLAVAYASLVLVVVTTFFGWVVARQRRWRSYEDMYRDVDRLSLF